MYGSVKPKQDPWLEQKEGDDLDFPLLFDAIYAFLSAVPDFIGNDV